LGIGFCLLVNCNVTDPDLVVTSGVVDGKTSPLKQMDALYTCAAVVSKR